MKQAINSIIQRRNLIYGVILFIIFAIDLEKDRDVWTWLWLLNAQLNLMVWAIREIRGVSPMQEE